MPIKNEQPFIESGEGEVIYLTTRTTARINQIVYTEKAYLLQQAITQKRTDRDVAYTAV